MTAPTLVQRLDARNVGQLRLGVAAALVFATLAAMSSDDGPVLCPLRRCSGGYCPACGLTRSGGRLLRGDLAGSWAQHPYLVLALVQIAAAGAVWRLGSSRLRAAAAPLMRPLLIGNVALFGLMWIVRMVDGSIPVPFLG